MKLQQIISDQRGMGLSTKIALGFGAAVGIIMIIAIVVFAFQSATA